MANLLPCPFCGLEPRKYGCVEADGFVAATCIRCDTCGIEMANEYEEDVVADWNRRAVNHHDALVEALEAFAACSVERSTAWAEEHEPWPDDHKLVGYDGWWLTAGMVRKARAALAAVRGQK